MTDSPILPSHPVNPEPAPPARHVTPEEEAAILAHADKLNARMTQILKEYG